MDGGRNTHPTPCARKCANLLSAVQMSGKTASGKNTPELLMIPVSAVGSSLATRFPEVSVRLPLHNPKISGTLILAWMVN